MEQHQEHRLLEIIIQEVRGQAQIPLMEVQVEVLIIVDLIVLQVLQVIGLALLIAVVDLHSEGARSVVVGLAVPQVEEAEDAVAEDVDKLLIKKIVKYLRGLFYFVGQLSFKTDKL